MVKAGITSGGGGGGGVTEPVEIWGLNSTATTLTFPYHAAAGETAPSPNSNFSINSDDYDTLYVRDWSKADPTDILFAYNSTTQNFWVIGYYNNLSGVWTSNIGGASLMFWEEPNNALKTWLEANATQIQ